MNLLPIFPVVIGKDIINLDSKYKEILKKNILDQEIKNKNINVPSAAWTGDVNNNEYLHKSKIFNELFLKINKKIQLYIDALGYKVENLNIYFQRSWATVSKKSQHIAMHAHLQSHLSFAYYLSLPEGSGKLEFHNERSYNELINGSFSKAELLLNLTKNLNEFNTPNLNFNIKENEIYFFPSKLKHRTTIGNNSEPRISLSSDIVVTLKEDMINTELGMADISNWTKF